jgi:hypothetical protein
LFSLLAVELQTELVALDSSLRLAGWRSEFKLPYPKNETRTYRFPAPRAPALQPVHRPAPLPLPTILAQRWVKLINSPWLSGAGQNGDSPIPKMALLVGSVCAVTAHARKPGARLLGVIVRLVGSHVVPVNVG